MPTLLVVHHTPSPSTQAMLESVVYGLYVQGNDDTAGAVRAVTSIAHGLGWQPARDPVTVLGEPERADLEASGNSARRSPPASP